MKPTTSSKPLGKSKYAKKLARKAGNGPVSPRWMWWLEGPVPRRMGKV